MLRIVHIKTEAVRKPKPCMQYYVHNFKHFFHNRVTELYLELTHQKPIELVKPLHFYGDHGLDDILITCERGEGRT